MVIISSIEKERARFVESEVQDDIVHAIGHASEADQLTGLQTILLTDGDAKTKKEQFKNYFNATFTIFERLHELFNNGDALFTKHEFLTGIEARVKTNRNATFKNPKESKIKGPVEIRS